MSSEEETKFIAYAKVMAQLKDRLSATPEELAVWTVVGTDELAWRALKVARRTHWRVSPTAFANARYPRHGWLAAFKQAHLTEEPPLFDFSISEDDFDYKTRLMQCWFRADEVAAFKPSARYIAYPELVSRWQDIGLDEPKMFVAASVQQERLNEIHPITGRTQLSRPGQDYPPEQTAILPWADVQRIETQDGINELSAGERANDATQTTRGESGFTRRQARKLDTYERYEQWRAQYRLLKKQHPGKPKTWIAMKISRMKIGRGYESETIRKRMTQ